MSELSRSDLRAVLVDGYADLVGRLSRMLGSHDLAEDALQDAYIHLETSASLGPVRNPRAYLLRMAVNLSRSRQRVERRRLTVADADAVLDQLDESPGPDQIVEARSELAALQRALAQMPSRRREMFLAAWSEDLPNAEIAKRFGVTARTVQLELKAAAQHCADKLEAAGAKKFAKPLRLTSLR